MGRSAMARARDRIAELGGRGGDLVTLWGEAAEALAAAVPYDVTPCFFTLDPASLLITSHYQDGLPEIPAEWLAEECRGDDFNRIDDVVRSASGVSTLHEATGGRPERSRRYRTEMREYGCEQEVVVALRDRSGEAWGCLGLYRLAGRPPFDAEELRLLADVSGHLAEGARRALLLGEARDPEGPGAPGLVVLGDDWALESATPGVEALLSDLPGGGAGRLPPAVLAVAGRARRTAGGEDPGEVAAARVLTESGRWVVLHGAALVSGGAARTAVIVEPAHPARIAPLLMAAYGLTEREQQVTRLVLQGESTAGIAERLVVSPHTVQQHLKGVFEKTGVRSRRELAGSLFFAHYEPRVRDNERRAGAGLPLRGGPAVSDGAPAPPPAPPG